MRIRGAVLGETTDTVLWQGSPEATAAAVREASGGGVDVAIEATGRPETMLTAYLATRQRGAAVLVVLDLGADGA